MKLQDFFGDVVENKINGQLNTNIRRRALARAGISTDDLLEMEVKKFKRKVL